MTINEDGSSLATALADMGSVHEVGSPDFTEVAHLEAFARLMRGAGFIKTFEPQRPAQGLDTDRQVAEDSFPYAAVIKARATLGDIAFRGLGFRMGVGLLPSGRLREIDMKLGVGGRERQVKLITKVDSERVHGLKESDTWPGSFRAKIHKSKS